MTKIRLTKRFTFEAAHALEGYDGPCRHIHGHSYTLLVTVIGSPCAEQGNPKLGMVMDFGDLKRIVKEHVTDRLDHCLILREGSPLATELQTQYGRIIETDFQPTCENMLRMIADLLIRELHPEVTLHSLRLHETADSFAEWYASDNDY